MKKNLIISLLIFTILFSCKKDEDPVFTLDSATTVLTSGGTHQIVIKGSTTEKFTYKSDNDFIATVDESGLITGKRVGETVIKVSGNGFIGECKSTINPLYNTFNEPITSFGIKRSEVKSKETRTIFTETETITIYKGSLREKYVAYFFENGILTHSAVILSSAYSSALGSYMAERYVIVSVDPVLAYSVDYKFMVGTSLTDDLDWFVMYMPKDNNKAAHISSRAKEEVLKSKIMDLLKK